MKSTRFRSFGACVQLLLAAAVLTSCGVGGAADPVSAVTEDVRGRHGATPTVRAVVPLSGGTVVLYSLQQGTDCFFGEMMAVQQLGRWHAASGGMGGGPCPGAAGAAQQAYSSSSGTSSSSKFTWSIASGEIFDPAITRVDVVWDDGTVMPAVVTNGIYYSIREGVEARVTSIEAYDDAGQIVPEVP